MLKRTKKPKEVVHMHVEKEITKYIEESVEKEFPREVVPSKTGILKRTKKLAHRPLHSLERPIVQEGSKHVSSTKGI